MSLPIPARNAFKNTIEQYCKDLIKQGVEPAKQARKKWKYQTA